MTGSLQLIIVKNDSVVRIPRKFINRCVSDIEKALKKRKIIGLRQFEKKNLVLAFVTSNDSKTLNKKYRNKNRPTDVLSFDPLDSDSLGELILCASVIERQRNEHKFSFRQELAYMILHGLLHLLGFDHEKSETEASRMFHLQDSIYDELDT